MAQDRFQDYIAALSRLPWQPSAALQWSDRQQQLIDDGLSASTMKLLDGLAAMCVRDPSDSYSTALLLQPSGIDLFVATSGDVLDHVEHRLHDVWQFMRDIHKHEDAASLRRTRQAQPLPSLRRFSHDFCVTQCRYAMTTLRTRLTEDGTRLAKSLRAMLGCYAPHTAEVSVLLEAIGRVHEGLSTSETRFVMDCAAMLDDLCILVAPTDLAAETIVLVLRKMEVLNNKLKHMVSQDTNLLSMMEIIRDLPILDLFRRILWLSDPCVDVPAFALSPRFAPWVEMPLRVHRVASVRSLVDLNFDLERLAFSASMAFIDETRKRAQTAITKLLERLRMLERQAASQEVQLHSGMALLQHLDQLEQQAVKYIGQSGQCCLPCYLFLLSYNRFGHRYRFHVRGTHGRASFPWMPPHLCGSNVDGILDIFSRSLRTFFYSAWKRRANAQELRSGLYFLAADDDANSGGNGGGDDDDDVDDDVDDDDDVEDDDDHDDVDDDHDDIDDDDDVDDVDGDVDGYDDHISRIGVDRPVVVP
ncbi:hypothetical protein AURDEDRAFT_185157 [Auricularia subglabra TFB-10046 SS5]|nr:hypothetical protein AURDEDRAFT_185157 [Auricularia subglabra TFB-10046 SS5]